MENLTNLQESINKALAGTAEQITDAVVKELSDMLVKERVVLLIKALTRLKEFDKDLKKIRPTKSYSADRKVATENYSEAQNKELGQLEEKKTSLFNAANSALKDNTAEAFNKLQGKLK